MVFLLEVCTFRLKCGNKKAFVLCSVQPFPFNNENYMQLFLMRWKAATVVNIEKRKILYVGLNFKIDR